MFHYYVLYNGSYSCDYIKFNNEKYKKVTEGKCFVFCLRKEKIDSCVLKTITIYSC